MKQGDRVRCIRGATIPIPLVVGDDFEIMSVSDSGLYVKVRHLKTKHIFNNYYIDRFVPFNNNFSEDLFEL